MSEWEREKETKVSFCMEVADYVVVWHCAAVIILFSSLESCNNSRIYGLWTTEYGVVQRNAGYA